MSHMCTGMTAISTHPVTMGVCLSRPPAVSECGTLEVGSGGGSSIKILLLCCKPLRTGKDQYDATGRAGESYLYIFRVHVCPARAMQLVWTEAAWLPDSGRSDALQSAAGEQAHTICSTERHRCFRHYRHTGCGGCACIVQRLQYCTTGYREKQVQ